MRLVPLSVGTIVALIVSAFNYQAKADSSLPEFTEPQFNGILILKNLATSASRPEIGQALIAMSIAASDLPARDFIEISFSPALNIATSELAPVAAVTTANFEPNTSSPLLQLPTISAFVNKKRGATRPVVVANAEDLKPLQEQFLLPEPQEEPSPLPTPPAPSSEASQAGTAPSPGSSAGSPTAFGASWGNIFAGASFQARTRFSDKVDGAFVAGFGLGDARKTVGLEVAVTVYDLIGSPFQDGSVSIRLHRLLRDNLAIAFGIENVIIWGEIESSTNENIYGVVSNIFHFRADTKPFSSLTASIGIGDGRFRTEQDVFDRNDTVNLFGSLGLRVAQPITVIADWTGQDLNLGFSIVPYRKLPLTITPVVADVTNSAGDGPRFALSLGYGFSFYSPRF